MSTAIRPGHFGALVVLLSLGRLLMGCQGSGSVIDVAGGHGGKTSGTPDASAGGTTGTGGETAGAGGVTGTGGSTNTTDAGPTTDASAGGAGGAVGVDGGRAGAGGSGGAPVVGVIPGCDAMTAHMRANDATDALIRSFWNTGSRYFNAKSPGTTSTGYWTFAEAWEAVLDGVERSGGTKYKDQIATIYAGAAASRQGWTSFYYDDESWMVLALIRSFDATGTQAYLTQAVTIYKDIMNNGWDGTSAHPGGIWWNGGKTQKATASNAGPVIGGVLLSAATRTNDPQYLTFARKVYDFWFMTMVDPASHQVADHLLANGTVQKGELTYNEGLMMGAAQTLYDATHEAPFLKEAQDIAGALIKSKSKMTSAGMVLSDGTNTGCVGDCPQWKATGYRFLATLFGRDPSHTEYLPVLQGSVNAAWTLARSANGLFANDWAGPTMTTNQVEGQASTATALSSYAQLCGRYPAGL